MDLYLSRNNFFAKRGNPRVYWATMKRRNPQLIAICKQLKLNANDGKSYLTDVVDENGITYYPFNRFKLRKNIPNAFRDIFLIA